MVRDPQRRSLVGVFGGTFDPVHNGHLRVALDALEQLDLREVRLVPLAHAVHRAQPVASAALRAALLDAAVAGRPGLVVDRRELARDGPSYTVDTLRELRDELTDQALCLLLGGDAFNGFAGWREPEAILALANLALLTRPEAQLTAAARELFAARRVERLDPDRCGQIVTCPVTQLDIASSDIRARRAAGRTIDFLVPDPALALIKAQGLYA